VTSDNGHVFLDCRFADGIEDPAALEETLAHRAGVVETGLFLGLASEAVVATPTGVETLFRPAR
jgi:ribose 5-phosphate isomerase A